jgi:hypothetical protein
MKANYHPTDFVFNTDIYGKRMKTNIFINTDTVASITYPLFHAFVVIKRLKEVVPQIICSFFICPIKKRRF